MDSLPELLIVHAVGNDSYQGLYSARDSASRSALQEGLVMLRNESTTYADRIIFVGETDSNGNRSNESNAFTGLVDLYAPGYNVPVLLPNGTVGSGRGTSFAAPTVAGIAGQLLAMDSSLSAADLKNLLMRGARDSVENSNGDNTFPNPVGNTTDVVYEADAFGSLRLLSSRGGGRPLCGAIVEAVRAKGAPPGQDHAKFAVVAKAYEGGGELRLSTDVSGDSLLYPGSPFGPQLSVAPGGRSFAVTSVTALEESRTNVFQLTNGTWNAVRKIDDSFGMFFGERDTLFLDNVGATFATTGGRLPIAPYPFVYPINFVPGGFSFAPDGSAYAATTQEDAQPATVTIARRSGVTSVFVAGNNLYASGRTAWTPDSRTLLLSRLREIGTSGTQFESAMTALRVGSSSVAVLQQEVIVPSSSTAIASLNVSDEGGRVRFRMSGPFLTFLDAECTLRSASVASLKNVRVDRQYLPEPCGVYTPPPGGGGGQEGRVTQAPGGIAARVAGNPRRANRALTMTEQSKR